MRRLIYLAAPYSHVSKFVQHQRHTEINRVACLLLAEGLPVFSPITHSATIANTVSLPKTWDFWRTLDEVYLQLSAVLVVLMLDGWDGSVGVTAEIEIARKSGIRIFYCHPSVFDSASDWKASLLPKLRAAIAAAQSRVSVQATNGHTIEKDPLGKSPDDPGAKLDHGKPRMSLVLDGFARALFAIGEVGTAGAAKYTEHGWLEVPNAKSRYRDALYRHLFAAEDNDANSGQSHLAHAAWNLLAILELELREQGGKLPDRSTGSMPILQKSFEGFCPN